MSLFSKLLKKDVKENDGNKNDSSMQTQDRICIETHFATFTYINYPNEVGYEADLEWYGMPVDEEGRLSYLPVGCYIDCNTPETTDASLCLDRLTRLFEDKYGTDTRVKLAVANYFADENGLIKTSYGEMISKEDLMNELEIRFISVCRDGKTTYSLYHMSLDIDGDVHIVFNEDGSVAVMDEKEFYNFE
jgi:hypothetical protein